MTASGYWPSTLEIIVFGLALSASLWKRQETQSVITVYICTQLDFTNLCF